MKEFCRQAAPALSRRWVRGGVRDAAIVISSFERRRPEVVQTAWMLLKSAQFTRSSRAPEAGDGDGREVRVLGGQGRAGNVREGLLPLNMLSDNKGSKQERTRIGRGMGSGKGKTSGKGHKGQKARSGRSPRLGFEGGQTPLRLRIPKRGFTNTLGLSYQPVNLNTISELVEKGRIDASQLITMKTLKDAGAVGKKTKDGMKLLGRGAEEFSLPVHVEVSRVSDRAKLAIEAAGGSVRRVHYNQLGLRALLDPDWFSRKGRLLPQPARPPLKFLSDVEGAGRLPAPATALPVGEKEVRPSSTSRDDPSST